MRFHRNSGIKMLEVLLRQYLGFKETCNISTFVPTELSSTAHGWHSSSLDFKSTVMVSECPSPFWADTVIYFRRKVSTTSHSHHNPPIQTFQYVCCFKAHNSIKWLYHTSVFKCTLLENDQIRLRVVAVHHRWIVYQRTYIWLFLNCTKKQNSTYIPVTTIFICFSLMRAHTIATTYQAKSQQGFQWRQALFLSDQLYFCCAT